MCGICGLIDFKRQYADAYESIVKNMVAGLRHRGPDGTGSYVKQQCAIAHTRLAIIDPKGGHQPLFNEDGSVAITFNGEIYNFKELRQELVHAGHLFRTDSDTEVIVHAWEEWGKDCVTHFRGMFAFAIADWNQNILFLARDHLGIKPLYYVLDHDSFAFASEPDVLRAIPGVDDKLDFVALDQYLLLGYIPAPNTAFASIKKLAAGAAMEIDFNGTFRGPWRYWGLTFQPDYNLDKDEWVERLDATIRESVAAHLVSDVPFGAFLSGGMDSTLVVGYMSEILKDPVRTFSIGFANQDFDETSYALQAADKLHTMHTSRQVEPQVTGILELLVSRFGEPFGDASAIPTYYISQMAREFVPMVLSGDGGDEGLGGYRRYEGWVSGRHHVPTRARIRMWLRALRNGKVQFWAGRNNGQGGTKAFLDWMYYVNLFDINVRRRLWRKEYHSSIGKPVELFEETLERRGGTPDSALGQYLDYNTYLPEDILRKVDVASMAHGLEVRTPLVDIRVVELLMKIPSNFTTASYKDGVWQSKPLLRALLSRKFDDSFIDRPKKGFMLPLKHWLAQGGGSRAWAVDLVCGSESRVNELFSRQSISDLFSAHDSGQDCSLKIWQLIFLEMWLRHIAATTGKRIIS